MSIDPLFENIAENLDFHNLPDDIQDKPIVNFYNIENTMEITTGAVAKAGVATALIGAGGTSIYLGYDYLVNSISVYDIALIQFLEDDKDNNIIFEVKKGSDGNEDLDPNDISLSDASKNPITAQIKVTANASDQNFKKGKKSDGASDLEKIKKLGEGENG